MLSTKSYSNLLSDVPGRFYRYRQSGQVLSRKVLLEVIDSLVGRFLVVELHGPERRDTVDNMLRLGEAPVLDRFPGLWIHDDELTHLYSLMNASFNSPRVLNLTRFSLPFELINLTTPVV